MRKFLVFLSVFLLGSLGVKGQSLFGEEQIISLDVYRAWYVCAGDLDGDSNLDILATSRGSGDNLVWFKNDGNGNFSLKKIIDNNSYGIWSANIADLDNDKDLDIISYSPSIGNNRLVWYENDGNGNFSTEIPISENIYQRTIFTADLDGDGDVDILIASFDNDKIIWYENDGQGNFINETLISTNADGPNGVYAVDLDNDDDLDILSSSGSDNKIAWYKNDGIGNFSTEILISIDINAANGVYAADLDNDMNMDVIATSSSEGKIVWYKNDGNENFGEQNIITTSADGIYSILSVDLDNDQDMDVISASANDDKIAWYENNGDGVFSEQNIISMKADDARSVYIADLDRDGDMEVISASANDDKIAWYENFSDNLKMVSSFAFYDSNENGVYEEDNPLLNYEITLTPSEKTIYSNPQGYTYFFVGNGEYQLSAESNTLWELTTPETYNITITDNSELATYYFGFKPTRILPRVKPYISSSPTRCSQESTYWLNYTNTGTTIANGTITLESDELMQFISSNPEPDVIEGRKLTWNITDLYPSFENKIQLQFQMPDFNFIGEILETQASIELFNENQELVYSKSTQYDSEVRCSYDPNDKLARSNLLGQSEFTYLADTIYYTVRFQNTGNDTAFNIRIEDVLDKKLDLTTFHPITASHNYRTELNRETGLATFYFDDILLPDSTTNEVESHGFVTFAVASLADLDDKIEVENTASIFFDFNPAIVTNMAVLTLIEQVETDIEDLDMGYSILIRPNPFSDYTTIEIGNLPQRDYRLEVMDILGRKVSELKVQGGKTRLERGNLETGLYLIRILEEENGRILGSGKVLVE